MNTRGELIALLDLALGSRRAALRALAAIEAAECVVVPRKITDAMLEAGADASDGYGLETGCWDSAIAASPFAPETTP